jgi:glycosyltransferase involved in cell wall biosynthesis
MSLDRTPQIPPQILPLSEDKERQLLSVMIPTYNCTGYLKETLESVLQQDLGEQKMQIEVVDDFSTDANVEELVKEIGKGRIKFFRQVENVGSLRNFETCINRSKGRLIHMLHGDDRIKPGFYAKILQLFEENPTAGAAFTGLAAIDDKGVELYHNNEIQGNEGIIKDWLLKIAEKQRLQVCAIVVKRTVYERLGSFYKVHFGEDWEMWARIAANYPVAYSPVNLAQYRLHGDNISSKYLASGQNIEDIKMVIDAIEKFVPEPQRKQIKNISKRNFSITFAYSALEIFRKHGNVPVALKQGQGALKLHFNLVTFFSLLKLYAKIALNYRKQ